MRKPWAVMAAAIAVVSFLALWFIVPAFEARWANLGVSLSSPLELLVQASHVVTRFSLIFIGILAALVFLALRPEPTQPGTPRE